VRNYTRRLTALALVAIGLAGQTPAPSSTAIPDAATILQRSLSRWQGLTSYQVPVTISGSARVAIISLPFKMTGTQYYQAPDQQALHLDNPPRIARSLGNTLAGVGTPQTWLRDYDIGTPVVQAHGRHAAYVLTGTPKRQSRVKSMTMWVSATTYGIETITFSYINGATLTIMFQRHRGFSQYHLARSATLSARFPQYSGDAKIVYGDYQLNQPIPASVFEEH
jgi:outer membrane lipoprotein-sorting protein